MEESIFPEILNSTIIWGNVDDTIKLCSDILSTKNVPNGSKGFVFVQRQEVLWFFTRQIHVTKFVKFFLWNPCQFFKYPCRRISVRFLRCAPYIPVNYGSEYF